MMTLYFLEIWGIFAGRKRGSSILSRVLAKQVLKTF